MTNDPTDTAKAAAGIGAIAGPVGAGIGGALGLAYGISQQKKAQAEQERIQRQILELIAGARKPQDVELPPDMVNALTKYIAENKAMSRQQGLDLASKVAYQQAAGQAAQQAGAERQAIELQARRQGNKSAGRTAALQLMAGQGTTNRLASEGQMQAAQSRQRQLQAQAQAAQTAQGLGQAQYGAAQANER